MVPLVFRHLPAGTSVKVMSQWAQVRIDCAQHAHYDIMMANCLFIALCSVNGVAAC
jgi:hypothetical protein